MEDGICIWSRRREKIRGAAARRGLLARGAVLDTESGLDGAMSLWEELDGALEIFYLEQKVYIINLIFEWQMQKI